MHYFLILIVADAALNAAVNDTAKHMFNAASDMEKFN